MHFNNNKCFLHSGIDQTDDETPVVATLFSVGIAKNSNFTRKIDDFVYSKLRSVFILSTLNDIHNTYNVYRTTYSNAPYHISMLYTPSAVNWNLLSRDSIFFLLLMSFMIVYVFPLVSIRSASQH